MEDLLVEYLEILFLLFKSEKEYSKSKAYNKGFYMGYEPAHEENVSEEINPEESKIMIDKGKTLDVKDDAEKELFSSTLDFGDNQKYRDLICKEFGLDRNSDEVLQLAETLSFVKKLSDYDMHKLLQETFISHTLDSSEHRRALSEIENRFFHKYIDRKAEVVESMGESKFLAYERREAFLSSNSFGVDDLRKIGLSGLRALNLEFNRAKKEGKYDFLYEFNTQGISLELKSHQAEKEVVNISQRSEKIVNHPDKLFLYYDGKKFGSFERQGDKWKLNITSKDVSFFLKEDTGIDISSFGKNGMLSDKEVLDFAKKTLLSPENMKRVNEALSKSKKIQTAKSLVAKSQTKSISKGVKR